MSPNSALSLGLPPPPTNAPHTINIDATCALFSLEIQCGRDKSTVRTDWKESAARNGPEREVPRLYRILNRPEPAIQRSDPPPAISPNSSSSEESPNHSPIGSPDDKENKPPVFIANHGSEDGGLHLRAHAVHRAHKFEAPKRMQTSWMDEQQREAPVRLARQYSRSSTNDMYQPAGPARKQGSMEWKEGGSLANALGPRESVRKRQPLGDLESSLLPAEKRVIQRPVLASSSYTPQFTNPFDGNVPIPTSFNGYPFPDIPDIPELYPSRNVDAPGHQQSIPVPSSPPLLYNSDLGVTSFMTITCPSELVALHRRRIYPSSTEPDWCVGETIEYVPRRKVFPDALDEPVVTISTLEVAAPKPVHLGQIRDTQRWLQRLASDLGAD
ncbi:hypothetical protein AAF712_008860 [Marasmius tenuissimus]|uniref:Uncharacterized protein n=1 Tax=Marasmius tenuissimus TaxID=585030 RepID=A0ABR2ZRY9_9AGAR